MILRKLYIGGVFALLMTMIACQPDVVLPIENSLGSNYYPIDKGYYWEYEVDSVIYDDFTGLVDSSRYLVREEVVDTIRGLNDELSYHLTTSARRWDYNQQTYGKWSIPVNWTARKEERRFVRTEDGVSYVSLVFPLLKGETWDGNALNSNPTQLYKFNNTLSDTTIGLYAFQDLVEIIEKDNENLIEKQYAMSLYAADTGRVYKEIIDVESNTLDDPDIPILERVSKGVIIKCRLVSLSVN